MAIELQEAMKLYPFSEAKLIAGHAGIRRQVVSANIQEVPYVDRWMKGGEILFTAGYAFQNAQNGCEMMERLDRVGIAALAIKPGQYLPVIPDEMVDCANRLGLPLFELPEDLPYMDCIVTIFERITQKQLSLMLRVENMHNMLTQTILNNEGLDGICSILNQVTGSPVFILNPEGGFQAFSVGEGREEDYLERMRGLFEEHCTKADARKMNHNQCNTVLPEAGCTLIVVPIFVQDEHIAYLALDMSRNEVMEMDLIAFERASSMIAVELLREQALMQKEQKVREQFLEDLLERRFSDEKMMVQRGRHIGFDVLEKYCAFVVDADAFEQALKRSLHDLPEAEVQKLKLRVQQVVREGMETYKRPSLVLDSGMGATGVFIVRKAEDVATCARVIRGIIAELEKLNPHLSFSAGIGRVKQGLTEAKDSYDEATLAMRSGRSTLGMQAQGKVYIFEELGCLCFLSELSGSGAMQAFYNENMRALEAYDRENNAELVKTLESYFACRGNLRRTAEMLYVHKNSVIYRLNKIENLLGRKLDDHRTSFDLELCFKLRSILPVV